MTQGNSSLPEASFLTLVLSTLFSRPTSLTDLGGSPALGPLPQPWVPPCTWDVLLWKKAFLSVHPDQLRSSGKSPDFPDLGIWPGGPTAEAVQLLQSGADARHSSRPSEPTMDGHLGGPYGNWGRGLPTPPRAGGLLSCPECSPARVSEGLEATVLNASWNIKGRTHARAHE